MAHWLAREPRAGGLACRGGPTAGLSHLSAAPIEGEGRTTGCGSSGSERVGGEPCCDDLGAVDVGGEGLPAEVVAAPLEDEAG